MWDICLISRDAGYLMKMRDCPAECGTVDMYADALTDTADDQCSTSRSLKCDTYDVQLPKSLYS